MTNRSFWLAIVAAACSAAVALAAEPAPQPAVEAQADAALRKMSTFLGAAKSFTFECHTSTEQLLDSGQKVEYARNQQVAIRRPNAAAAKVTGDQDDFQLVYQGKTVTLYNPRTKAYGTIEVPDSIDDMLDTLAQKYGMVVPLADLLISDPYKTLAPLLRSGQYLGTGYVFDTKCDHLAFRQTSVDWQIWIEQGATPVPRKVVITYKDSPANLQYTAYLSKWNMSPTLPEAAFTFTPPADARKVDAVVPATQGAGEKR
jgi:hypothetical protein